MISVFVIDDKPFIWKAADVQELRERHRIVGTLVGCLPRCPAQNTSLGLPLQLMPEEATLLADKGVVILVDGAQERAKPTDTDIEEYEQLQTEIHDQQNKHNIQARREDMIRRRQEIIDGRIKKLQSTNSDQLESDVVDIEPLMEDAALTLSRKRACVMLPTASCNPPTQPAKWNFPQSEIEKLRYKTFCDLWAKGYYLTTAAKFGGHFLCYPGDPARFHSMYIAVCIPPDQALPGHTVSSLGRLATTVNKTVLLCSLDHNELTFMSLHWSGII